RILGRDLEDRTEDDLRLDPVAVHVFEAQLGDRRTPRALVVNAAAIEGVVNRFYRPRVAGDGRLAAPGAPNLAVADPYRLAVALLDARRAVAQRGGKAAGPQIGWQ